MPSGQGTSSKETVVVATAGATVETGHLARTDQHCSASTVVSLATLQGTAEANTATVAYVARMGIRATTAVPTSNVTRATPNTTLQLSSQRRPDKIVNREAESQQDGSMPSVFAV